MCGKFADVAFTLSGGWIRTAEHYYSQEAIEAKKLVFPTDYDAKTMFWLINEDGVYGARSGLLLLAKEMFRGIFKLVEEKIKTTITLYVITTNKHHVCLLLVQ